MGLRDRATTRRTIGGRLAREVGPGMALRAGLCGMRGFFLADTETFHC